MDIECIFCHSTTQIGNKSYILHLYQHHKIKFDMNHVIKRTKELLENQKSILHSSTATTTVDTNVVGIVNGVMKNLIEKQTPSEIIGDLITDIIENVTQRQKPINMIDNSIYLHTNKLSKPINENLEDFNISNKSHLLSSQCENTNNVGSNVMDVKCKINPFDNPVDESCLSFNESDNSSPSVVQDKDQGESSIFSKPSDISSPILYFTRPIDESCGDFEEPDISDKSLLSETLNVSIEEESADSLELKENNNFGNKFGEKNFNCYVKVKDIRKESDNVLYRKLKEKRKFAKAFVEGQNLAERRKSARLEVKSIVESRTNVSAKVSKDTADMPKATEKVSKVLAEMSKIMTGKSKVTEETKNSVEKVKVDVQKLKLDQENPNVLIENAKIKTEIPTVIPVIGSLEVVSRVNAEKSKVAIERPKVVVENQNVLIEKLKVKTETPKVIPVIGILEEVSRVNTQKPKNDVGDNKVITEVKLEPIETEVPLIENPELLLNEESLQYLDDFLTNNVESKSSNSKRNMWYHGTIYSCQLCTKQYLFKQKLKIHWESSHSAKFEDYEEKSIQTNVYECELCGKGFSWYKSAIESHLTKQHNMDIGNYFEKFKDDIQLPNIDITDETLFSNLISDGDYDWANKCIYKCALCHNEFKSRSKFGTHLKSKHKLSITDYTKEHGISISHEEKHSCQVKNCNSYLWWDRQAIKAHLYGIHDKMSLEEYESTFMNTYTEKNNHNLSQINPNHEWDNQCIFQCALCKQTFNSRFKFGTHLKSNHQLFLRDYTKTYGTSISQEKKHHCQFESCDTVIIWDRSSIARHLRNLHGLVSIEDYKEKYMDNYVEKAKESNVEEEQSMDSLYSTETDNEWSNKCTFTCEICQVTVNSHSKFGTHIKHQHKITLTEYSKEHGTYISHEEKHSCQVENCFANMWWDRQKIKSHLWFAHDKMAIDEYNEKYMSNYKDKPNSNGKLKISNQPPSNAKESLWANRCIFKCGICGFEASPRRKLEKHLEADHKMTIKDHAKQFGRIMSHEEKHSCQVENCNSSLFWDRKYIFKHLHIKHDKMSLEEYKEKYMPTYEDKVVKSKGHALIYNNHDRYSECQFSCNICKPGKVFYSRSKAGTHMKAIHGISLKKYKEEHGTSISYKINHTCHLCAASLLWDKSAISNHLYGVHEKMSISDYFEKFIDNFEDDSEWLNRHSLACKECKKEPMFTTKNHRMLWKHVKNVHNKTETEYRNIHGSMYCPVLPESHSCQICLEKVNWESISLKPHIEIKHKMTVTEYHTKFMKSYRKRHLSVVQKTPNDAKKSVDNEEVVDEEILKWTTGSLYMCKICDKGVAGLYQFKMHLETRHDTNYKQYEKNYQPKEFILFEGFHICARCMKNVKHDKIYLQNHMKEHNLSIREYMDKYKPNPPKLHRMMKERQQASVKKE